MKTLLRRMGDFRFAAACFTVIIHMCLCGSLTASPFARRFQYTQPNGVQITLWGQGDEFGAVFETLDGYTVVFTPETRAYYYARLSADRQSLEPTAAMVGRESPVTKLGLTKHLRIDSRAAARAAQQRREAWDAVMRQTERWTALKAFTLGTEPHKLAPPSFQTVGLKCGLTILIDFEDERGTFTREEISEFLNGDNYTGFGNNGSVKEYFADVSGKRLTFTNVVTPYITIPNSVHPRSYYNDPTTDCFRQCQYLIRDALNVMKKLPNYTNDFLPLFGGVTVSGQTVVSANFFVAGASSGVWGKGIWGQTSALSFYVGQQTLAPQRIVNNYQLTPMENALEIMVFCHENGHLLCGFPDIYDYNYDSASGAGPLCLMAWGQNWAKNPSQVCAYLKTAAGWADVVDLPVGTNFQASLSSSGPDFNHFFRLRKPSVPKEYFLLENRQKAGRDAEIPGGGIVVWHIDEQGNRDNQSARTNTTHANYEISLEQADNRWDLEYMKNFGDAEDLFYKGNPSPGYGNAFSDLTEPSAHWWNGGRSGLVLSDFSTNGETVTFQLRVDTVVIRVDPGDQTVVEGAAIGMGVSLSVPVSSTTIQWYKDGAILADADRISGATNNVLRITSATLSDAGRYSALIIYTTWTNWTREARVTVVALPAAISSYGSGTTTLLEDGVDLAAPASSFGATMDSFRFGYRQVSGDFDVRVQLLGISMMRLQTRAGLLARTTLGASAV